MNVMVPITRTSQTVHSSFALGMSQIRVPARKPALLTEGFRYFPYSLHAHAGITPQIGHNSFLPHLSQLTIQNSPAIWRCIIYGVENALLNKLYMS
jgi:hypothetical protein